MSAEPVQITTPPSASAAAADATPADADHRPEVYQEGGALIIRASAMGGCIRNLVAARMGIRAVAPNERALTRMNEGNIHEPWILKHLETLGWQSESTQSALELPIGGGAVIVRGHNDAIVTHESAKYGDRVAEAKAMGRDVWEKWRAQGWGAFRRYAYQLSIYMHITGLPGLFATKNRDTGEVDVTLWDEAPIPLGEIKLRALKVAAATELPDCDPVTFPCSRFFIHTGTLFEVDPMTGLEVKKQTGPAPNAVPDESAAAFDELARAYQEAKEECARAEAKRKEVGGFLLDFLRNHNMKKGVTERWVATEVSRTDRRVDTKALKAEHPEIAAQYTLETVSRYVKVTPRDDVADADAESHEIPGAVR